MGRATILTSKAQSKVFQTPSGSSHVGDGFRQLEGGSKDFDDLQALLWAHEHSSLQRASRETGVSRATLRRRLERLDAAVGRQTHVTGPEGITLTAAGLTLVDELVRATFKVMASPDYLAAHGRPETPADLVDHSVLHLGGTDLFWPVVADAPVAISPVHTCADLYLLGLLAGQGLGLALLPVRGPLVDDTIAALVPVLGEHIEVHRSLRLDLPVPSQPGSAAAALVEVAASFGQDWTELPEVR